MSDAFEKMDRMYRHQRYFYDITRKYYLLGRDRLLEELNIAPGDNVLEIGCGTGRNLAIIASRYPNANFFGLDASAAMLETAKAKLQAASVKNVALAAALAGDFSFDETFGLDRPFDAAYFSYSISMIPDWRQAAENALANIRPGGALYIVDFYDQAALPVWFRKLLNSWLSKFHVRYPSGLLPYLESREKAGAGKLSVRPLYRRYAFIAKFELPLLSA